MNVANIMVAAVVSSKYNTVREVLDADDIFGEDKTSAPFEDNYRRKIPRRLTDDGFISTGVRSLPSGR